MRRADENVVMDRQEIPMLLKKFRKGRFGPISKIRSALSASICMLSRHRTELLIWATSCSIMRAASFAWNPPVKLDVTFPAFSGFSLAANAFNTSANASRMVFMNRL